MVAPIFHPQASVYNPAQASTQQQSVPRPLPYSPPPTYNQLYPTTITFTPIDLGLATGHEQVVPNTHIVIGGTTGGDSGGLRQWQEWHIRRCREEVFAAVLDADPQSTIIPGCQCERCLGNGAAAPNPACLRQAQDRATVQSGAQDQGTAARKEPARTTDQGPKAVQGGRTAARVAAASQVTRPRIMSSVQLSRQTSLPRTAPTMTKSSQTNPQQVPGQQQQTSSNSQLLGIPPAANPATNQSQTRPQNQGQPSVMLCPECKRVYRREFYLHKHRCEVHGVPFPADKYY